MKLPFKSNHEETKAPDQQTMRASINEYYPFTEGKYHLGCKSQGRKAEGRLSCLRGSGKQSILALS